MAGFSVDTITVKSKRTGRIKKMNAVDYGLSGMANNPEWVQVNEKMVGHSDSAPLEVVTEKPETTEEKVDEAQVAVEESVAKSAEIDPTDKKTEESEEKEEEETPKATPRRRRRSN